MSSTLLFSSSVEKQRQADAASAAGLPQAPRSRLRAASVDSHTSSPAVLFSAHAGAGASAGSSTVAAQWDTAGVAAALSARLAASSRRPGSGASLQTQPPKQASHAAQWYTGTQAASAAPSSAPLRLAPQQSEPVVIASPQVRASPWLFDASALRKAVSAATAKAVAASHHGSVPSTSRVAPAKGGDKSLDATMARMRHRLRSQRPQWFR